MAYTTIKKPTDYFNTKLYTGNGSTNAITGVGFQPDLTWIKIRDAAGESHSWWDAVRTATKYISSNNDNAEATDATGLTAFDSDGFTLGSTGRVNQNTNTFASWNWKANGAGSANTDGSITSTVSANTTSGFSIVKYTGTGSSATIGHGLGVAPKVIMVKRTSASDSWTVGHNSIGWGKFLRLDNTSAEASNTSTWNNTAPTSTVFSVNHDDVNASGVTFIAYCFAEKTGFSKCNKYIGNGLTDGTFVYTGFKTAFALIKLSSATADWQIFDNKREGYNDANDALYPNLTNVEGSTARIQLLSNGFKLIDNNNWGWNKSGETYIYYAVAEEPLVGDNPATAR